MTLLDLPQVPLTLSQNRSDDADILSVSGYVDAFTVPTLRPVFESAVQSLDHPKAGTLILDLSCVRFIDHKGLEMLLSVREQITAQDCTLVIRLRPGSQPETLFRSSNLSRLLNAICEPEL